jgi:hypothetical protein
MHLGLVAATPEKPATTNIVTSIMAIGNLPLDSAGTLTGMHCKGLATHQVAVGVNIGIKAIALDPIGITRLLFRLVDLFARPKCPPHCPLI